MLSATDWDLKQSLLAQIKTQGGFVNTHSHLDRAYTITPATLHLGSAPLREKWSLVDDMKASSTVTQIYDRMAQGVEEMLRQGVKVMGSCIDVDSVMKDKSIQAATKIKEAYAKDITIRFSNQTLKGILEPEARRWFDLSTEFVDIICGLPGKDKGREAEHLDVLLSTAQRLHKMAHVHVDQLNDPAETETELLVQKTFEHGMQGKVAAIHGVSIAAHPQKYRLDLYRQMKKAGVMLICCPTAWIDGRRSEVLVPTHNSIAPVEELVANGITVSLGTDNIADIYKPFNDGSMWTELRFLLETCHYYDLEQLVKIATTNGRKVLGIQS